MQCTVSQSIENLFDIIDILKKMDCEYVIDPHTAVLYEQDPDAFFSDCVHMYLCVFKTDFLDERFLSGFWYEMTIKGFNTSNMIGKFIKNLKFDFERNGVVTTISFLYNHHDMFYKNDHDGDKMCYPKENILPQKEITVCDRQIKMPANLKI